MRDRLRVGCAGGYLEGRLDPGLLLASSGDCDYLGLEALNEAALSVLQRAYEHDPSAGFHTSGVESLVAFASRGPARIVSSIGGANPRGGALAVQARLRDLGIERRIGFVTGDNLTARLGQLVAQGALKDGSGRVLEDKDVDRAFAASAYLGARQIASALEQGADIVITGRVVDSALYLGPAMYEFGWAPDQWDQLAAGSTAGHLLECAGHLVGGNYWGPGWTDIDYSKIGHGIAEVSAGGEVIVTKHPEASGLITRDTVAQQLLYEVGDPSAYLLPDVTVDFTNVDLVVAGQDRVRVDGVVGHPAPETTKVLVSRRAGFIGSGTGTFSWPDAYTKARKAGESLARRLQQVHGFEEYCIEYIGAGSLSPAPGGRDPDSIEEVPVYVAAAAATAEQAALVFRELANLYDCAPAGACGIAGPTAGSNSGARERIDLMPCFVATSQIEATAELLPGA